jgi:pyruvate,water dikinase
LSDLSDGFVNDSIFDYSNISSHDLILTFNNLTKKTELVKIMDEILSTLERAWGQPVDTEFTASIGANGEIGINLLQCRPLRLPRVPDSPTVLPENLDNEHILFRTGMIINGGIIDAIKYIVYIDPDKYAQINSLSVKKSLGRVVGKLNDYFRGEAEKVIALGPGRWGSNNIDLGINVNYADIDNFVVLVELGRTKTGEEPEFSYGTHFFQDLVEANIIYMPVFPDKSSTKFNRNFFTKSQNVLKKILPEYAEFGELIQVIDVPASHKGAHAYLIADATTRKAVCYLK